MSIRAHSPPRGQPRRARADPPRRVIVRSFVALLRDAAPEDYSLEERSAFGLHELVHSGLKRAMAAILDQEFLHSTHGRPSDTVGPASEVCRLSLWGPRVWRAEAWPQSSPPAVARVVGAPSLRRRCPQSPEQRPEFCFSSYLYSHDLCILYRIRLYRVSVCIFGR